LKSNISALVKAILKLWKKSERRKKWTKREGKKRKKRKKDKTREKIQIVGEKKVGLALFQSNSKRLWLWCYTLHHVFVVRERVEREGRIERGRQANVRWENSDIEERRFKGY
jgi:hypothetical protein